jgi:hypothetical protein
MILAYRCNTTPIDWKNMDPLMHSSNKGTTSEMISYLHQQGNKSGLAEGTINCHLSTEMPFQSLVHRSKNQQPTNDPATVPEQKTDNHPHRYWAVIDSTSSRLILLPAPSMQSLTPHPSSDN